MALELSLDDAQDAQDEINRRVYHARGAHKTYLRTALNRAEVMALLKYQPCFAQRDVLDVGVGAGRTTLYMAPLAHRYEAIDYSPVMVQAMQRLWPQVSTRLVDMRRLSPFEDGSFDFVLASNNVLDAVSHQDRLRTFCELRRVLRPGGVVMFSAHNRALLPELRRPRLAWSRNPVNFARHALTWMQQCRHHRRMAALHVAACRPRAVQRRGA
ncbi:MAG: class I SAM-dependent methyltransferase [Aquabacterium sp.]